MRKFSSTRTAKVLGSLMLGLLLVGVSGCGGDSTKGTSEDLSRMKRGPSQEDYEAMKKATKVTPPGGPPPQVAGDKTPATP